MMTKTFSMDIASGDLPSVVMVLIPSIARYSDVILEISIWAGLIMAEGFHSSTL